MKLSSRAVLTLILCCAARSLAQEASPESEALRMRVEQIADQRDTTLYGVQVATPRTLARLYELRGFTPAWTSAAARSDMLRAVRDSAADGLNPQDYLLAQLESASAQAESPDAPLEARID